MTKFLVLVLLSAPLLARCLVVKRKVCADLCLSGLGGPPCGLFCNQEVRLEVKERLKQYTNSTRLTSPRRAMCGPLCQNNLGHPLCGCTANGAKTAADWDAICSAFCRLEGHTLYGCPTCGVKVLHRLETMQIHKQVEDVDWNALCNYLCDINEGGSACNCDIIP